MKKSSFMLAVANFCPKLIKTFNYGQNAANKRQLNEQYCLFSKLLRLFVDFSTTIVSIFYRVEDRKVKKGLRFHAACKFFTSVFLLSPHISIAPLFFIPHVGLSLFFYLFIQATLQLCKISPPLLPSDIKASLAITQAFFYPPEQSNGLFS